MKTKYFLLAAPLFLVLAACEGENVAGTNSDPTPINPVETPVVYVTVPEQAPPVVNVPPAEVTVNVPPAETPDVIVMPDIDITVQTPARPTEICIDAINVDGGAAPRNGIVLDNEAMSFEACRAVMPGTHAVSFIDSAEWQKLSPTENDITVVAVEGETKHFVVVYERIAPVVPVPLAPAVVTLLTVATNISATPPNSGLRWNGQVVNRGSYLVDTTGPAPVLSFTLNVGWRQVAPALGSMVVFDDLRPGEERTFTVFYEQITGPVTIRFRDIFGNTMSPKTWIDGYFWSQTEEIVIDMADGEMITMEEIYGFEPAPIVIAEQQLGTTITVVYAFTGVANVCYPFRNTLGNPIPNVIRRWDGIGIGTDECRAQSIGDRHVNTFSEVFGCSYSQAFRIEKNVLMDGETYVFPITCFPFGQSRSVKAYTGVASGLIAVVDTDGSTLYPLGWSFGKDEPAAGIVPAVFKEFRFGAVNGFETARSFPPNEKITQDGALLGFGCYNPSQYGIVAARGVYEDTAGLAEAPLRLTVNGSAATYEPQWNTVTAITCAPLGANVNVEFLPLTWGGSSSTLPAAQRFTTNAWFHLIEGMYRLNKSLYISVKSHEAVSVAVPYTVRKYKQQGFFQVLVSAETRYPSATLWVAVEPDTIVEVEIPDIHGFQPIFPAPNGKLVVPYDTMGGLPRNVQSGQYEYAIVLRPLQGKILTLTCGRIWDEHRVDVSRYMGSFSWSGIQSNVSLGDFSCMYLLQDSDYVVMHGWTNGYAYPEPMFLRASGHADLLYVATPEDRNVKIVERELVPDDRGYRLCLGMTTRAEHVEITYDNGRKSVFRGVVQQNEDLTDGSCHTLDRTRSYRIASFQTGAVWGIPPDTYQTNVGYRLRLNN